jgi:hypothetical protein
MGDATYWADTADEPIAIVRCDACGGWVCRCGQLDHQREEDALERAG